MSTDKFFIGKIPLVFSKKKLPARKEDDLVDIAKNWGFVSNRAPNQGFGTTKNDYTIYKPKGE